MKRLFALVFLLVSFSALAAAPKKTSVESQLPGKMINVTKAEVLDLSRDSILMMGSVLHPDMLFDGIKEYKLQLRVTSSKHGDLDYDCSLDQNTNKHELEIKYCVTVGHHIEIENITKGKELRILLKDI